MESEPEMSLINDNYDDQEIDDAPLSDNASNFDKEELRSLCDEEEQGTPPGRKWTKPTDMSTIAEEGEVTTSERFPMKDVRSVRVNDSEDSSLQFHTNAVEVLEKNEKEFFEDRAETMFIKDDPRFDNLNQEKENSWEPSMYNYKEALNEKSPKKEDTPEASKTKVFDFMNQSVFSAANAGKTSTPKREVKGTKFRSLDVSSINGSPRAPGSPGANATVASEVSFSRTMLARVMKKNLDSESLLKDLEQARMNRPVLPQRSTKRMNVMRPILSALVERSESVTSNREESRSASSRSVRSDISRTSRVDDKINETLKSRQSFQKPLEKTVQEKSRQEKTGGYPISFPSSRPLPELFCSSTTEEMVSRASTASAQQRQAEMISISPKRVSFGFVEHADTLSLDVTIKNISNRSIHVRASVDRDCAAFWIIDNRLIRLDPGQEGKAKVAFTPTHTGIYQAGLVVDVLSLGIKKTLHIWGMGGVANVLPVITDALSSTRGKEFVLRTSNYSLLTFDLKNSGARDAFARIDVYDGAMRKMETIIKPSPFICIRRRENRKIEIKMLQSLTREGTISRMSSSTRRSLDESDFIIVVQWGEEAARQRLKLLETRLAAPQKIHGISFTDTKYDGEVAFSTNPKTPKIMMDDLKLFEFSYRTTHILVYTARGSHFGMSEMAGAMPEDTYYLNQTNVVRAETFIQDSDVTRQLHR